MGAITSKWVSTEHKRQLLELMAEAKRAGVSFRRSSHLLGIDFRRIIRWRSMQKTTGTLLNRRPGPPNPAHRILPSEQRQILDMARREEFSDCSHRTMALFALEKQLFFASFSTVYRVMRAEKMTGMRGFCRRHNGNSLAPARPDLTGPNQRWCWDISYLPTNIRRAYLYLFLVLDEYSRKALNWKVSDVQTASDGKLLLEGAIEREGILSLPEDQRPWVYNDRGRQMKAKPVLQMFQDMQMPQLFSRPRTPNDNPFIEAAFSSTKCAPRFPGRFDGKGCAEKYFDEYFRWYNEEHYHSGIQYVTPQQAHEGRQAAIVAERKRSLAAQRAYRQEVNRRQTNKLDLLKENGDSRGRPSRPVLVV